MKKRISTFTLVVCLLCSAFSLSVSAANVSGSSASTTLSYTVDSYYSIVIPSTINLNNQSSFQVTATACEIGEGKQLVVEVDASKTYEDDNYLYLYKDKGSANEKKMRCRLAVSSNSDGTGGYFIDSEYKTDTIVATFHNGDTVPATRGYLNFITFPSGMPSGTYTGSVFFTIRIEDIA